jgi:hypothetical protein
MGPLGACPRRGEGGSASAAVPAGQSAEQDARQNGENGAGVDMLVGREKRGNDDRMPVRDSAAIPREWMCSEPTGTMNYLKPKWTIQKRETDLGQRSRQRQADASAPNAKGRSNGRGAGRAELPKTPSTTYWPGGRQGRPGEPLP